MPPPPPRLPGSAAAPTPKAPVVLDEDTYTQHLEAIIERDYFPELPKMANQLEWLRAVNSGDVREMQRAQRNIAKRRAAAVAAAAAGNLTAATPGMAGLGGLTPAVGLPPGMTPGTVGWGATTPGTALLRTPAMTPMVGGEVGPSSAAAAVPTGPGAGDAAAALAAAARGAVSGAARLSLDSFLDRYTSEDNASFQAILEEDNRRKRAKVRRLAMPRCTTGATLHHMGVAGCGGAARRDGAWGWGWGWRGGFLEDDRRAKVRRWGAGRRTTGGCGTPPGVGGLRLGGYGVRGGGGGSCR